MNFSVSKIKNNRYLISLSISTENYEIIGLAIRRILLSNSPGVKVIGIKVPGLFQEYDVFPGTHSDLSTILYRLQRISFDPTSFSESDLDKEFELNLQGPMTLTSDIFREQTTLVPVSKQVIAEIAEPIECRLICILKRGSGVYTPKEDDILSGVVNFNPVNSVVFRYEKEHLLFDITMTGDISPKESFINACNTLSKYLQQLVELQDITYNSDNFDKIELESIGLPKKSLKALQDHGFVYLSHLINKTDEELLSIPNFGQKSLTVLKKSIKQNK